MSQNICYLTKPQWTVYSDPHRFRVLVSGRRFGKTRMAIEEMIRAAATKPKQKVWYVAPTYKQAQEICWEMLKNRLEDANWIAKKNESKLSIVLKKCNSVISLRGAENFNNLRGVGLRFLVMDEFADIKPEAWYEVLRPTLSDTGGAALFTGTPKGRNWAYDLYMQGRNASDYPDWASFSYTTLEGGHVPKEEIEIARRDLDELTYRQEYEASWECFEGRCYYPFAYETHVTELAKFYNKYRPLIFCFDFNVSPGVAVICQELAKGDGNDMTAVIGEVHIPRNSNTPAVCRRLIHDWGEHEGEILCYGDASGGAMGTAKVQGSDWEIIYRMLYNVFGDRLSINVPRANPPERSRVNAVNSRLKSMSGVIRLMVDENCPNMIRDLEGVTLLEGGTGEIDKRADPKLTHLCFAGETMLNGDRMDKLPTQGAVKTMFGPQPFVNPGIRGFMPLVELVFDDGERLHLTPDHPVMTTGGWFEAQDMKDRLAVFDIEAHNFCQTGRDMAQLLIRNLMYQELKGHIRQVVEVKHLDGLHPVYCPKVDCGHFMLDNGLIVSNSDALGYYIVHEFPVQGEQDLLPYPVANRF